jgi:hypothetical protein
MACRAGDKYFGTDTAGATWSNWNGDVVFQPETWRVPKHRPPDGAATPATPAGPPYITDPRDGLSSLVEVVAAATEQGKALHAIGSGWAFEDCASADGVIVSLASLNSQLSDVVDPRNGALTDDWIGIHGNPASQTKLVHFEAGIRIWDLCEQLNDQGLALPTLGGSNGQALAGVISTSTHGGDWQQPPFPELVRAVHLVAEGGQEWWIESASRPLTRAAGDNAALRAVLPCDETKIVRDDRVFDAVRVACGRFGVIYSFVLEVRRQFRVVQVVTRPDAGAVLQALRDGQKTPSIFTPLFRLLNVDAIAPAFDDARGVPYFLQILFNSRRPSDVWVTRRWVTTDVTKPDILPPSQSYADLARDIVFTINTAAAGLAAVIGTELAALSFLFGPAGTAVGSALGLTAGTALLDVTAELDAMLVAGNKPFGSIVAAALNAAWKIPGLAELIAPIQESVISSGVHDGIRGPHYRVSTGTKEDGDQDDFRVDSIELVFDAAKPDYLDFLDEILPLAPLFPQAGIVSLRPTLRSSALLSMHNVTSNRAISVEIASLKNLYGNRMWMQYVHDAAVRHGGRPHWGQYNKLAELDVTMLYGDALSQWREALLSVNGTSSVFSNAFTRQRGLEPQSIARAVTSVMKSPKGAITHVCNDLESWSPVTVADAVAQIQARTVGYVAFGGGTFSVIKVVSDGKGGFYLRTQSDETSADNLDNLPLSTRA